MWKAGGVILGVILVLLILKILLKLYCSTDHFKKTFARQLEPFTKVYNAVLGTQKEKLFSQLRDHLQQTGGGEVLEIGSGTGANLEYLPGVSLVALDPNEHMEKIFRVNLEKYPAVTLRKYVVGKAEDLKTFDNGSLAAVLCTITLCSVPEKLIEKVFCEIKRVLKPVRRQCSQVLWVLCVTKIRGGGIEGGSAPPRLPQPYPTVPTLVLRNAYK